MKVSVIRGGGLAGILTATTLDTDDLAEPDAAALRDKVAEAKSAKPPPAGPGSPTQPDRFSYELTVEDDEGQHTIRAREQDLSPQLGDLIGFVQSAPARREEVRPPG